MLIASWNLWNAYLSCALKFLTAPGKKIVKVIEVAGKSEVKS